MAISDTPFWAFNIAYMLFLMPILCCLIAEMLSSDARVLDVNALPLHGHNDERIGLAAGAIVVGGLLALSVALQTALTTTGWKLNGKSVAQHKDDFARMAYLNVSLVFLGRVQWRIFPDSGGFWETCAFPALVVYFTVFFTLLFEMVRHINLHIGPDLVRNPRGLWITVVGVFVLVSVLHSHVRLAFAQASSFGYAYLGWLALALLGHAALHVTPEACLGGTQGTTKLHVHHWYWSFMAAHFAIFDSQLSCVSQALFISVYIHGAACFGLEGIFEPVGLKPF